MLVHPDDSENFASGTNQVIAGLVKYIYTVVERVVVRGGIRPLTAALFYGKSLKFRFAPGSKPGGEFP